MHIAEFQFNHMCALRRRWRAWGFLIEVSNRVSLPQFAEPPINSRGGESWPPVSLKKNATLKFVAVSACRFAHFEAKTPLPISGIILESVKVIGYARPTRREVTRKPLP